MLRGAKIAVVVPAYNEGRLIERTLGSIPAYVDQIVVVDDGSGDDTVAVTQRCRDPRVTLEQHPHNRGVGAAIATGYARAFGLGADVAAVMAGDAQMDPEDLLKLLEPLLDGEADYAKGDRLSHPLAFSSMPLARFVGNHILSMLTRWVTGLSVQDSQCGYTALSRRVSEHFALSSLWQGYGYPNDLLGHLAKHEARVRDVIVRPIYADERSGIRLRHALIVIPFVLARVLCRRLSAQRVVRLATARR